MTRTQIAGGVAVLAAAVGYWTPGVVFAGSVSHVRAVCSSGIGVLAQSLNSQAASGCSHAQTATVLLALLSAAGVAAILWPLVRRPRDTQDETAPDEVIAPGDEAVYRVARQLDVLRIAGGVILAGLALALVVWLM